MVEQLVARWAHNPEDAGSNPAHANNQALVYLTPPEVTGSDAGPDVLVGAGCLYGGRLESVITVVSGIRELDPGSIPDVELALAEELAQPGLTEVRLGGALGVDTVALAAACFGPPHVRVVVVVPFTLDKQPALARQQVQACRTVGVLELRLPAGKSAYLRRNDKMLEGAQRLLAFTDGRTSGGTAYTIDRARRLGLEVDVVPVGSVASVAVPRAERVQQNPLMRGPFSAPVFAWSRYVSRNEGAEWRSETIRALKSGLADPRALDRLADELAGFVLDTPGLGGATYVTTMPRRRPGLSSDLDPLAARLCDRTGQVFAPGWLQRVDEPRGGEYRGRRMRFPADEHARTMRFVAPEGTPGPGIVLDNVITTSGTMEGALRAVLRDRPLHQPVGLAVLFSEYLNAD